MQIHVFIQARIGSNRLPKKILKKICNKTIIELIVERVNQIEGIDKIFVLTGPKNKNLELIKEVKRLGISYYCGKEENILDRFYNGAKEFKSDIIIRVTGDSPLIDPKLISKGLDIFKESNCDVLSINRFKTFPYGINFEIFSINALEQSWKDISKKYSQEEFEKMFIPPTKHMLENKKFENYDLKNDEDLSSIRITLDYLEDLQLIEKLFEEFYSKNKYFDFKNIVDYLNKNPELNKLNKKYVHNYNK